MQLSGYTRYLVENDLKASDFLKLCLRAFGILSELRDEPLSADIPRELPRDKWYEEALAKARDTLSRRLAMTDGEWRKELESDLANMVAEHKRSLDKELAEMSRLNAAKEAIEGWECSEVYAPVKKFALLQIADSESECCRYDSETEESMRKALENRAEFEKYKAEVINDARRDVAYYEERVADAEAKWKKDNEFLAGFWKEIEQLG